MTIRGDGPSASNPFQSNRGSKISVGPKADPEAAKVATVSNFSLERGSTDMARIKLGRGCDAFIRVADNGPVDIRSGRTAPVALASANPRAEILHISRSESGQYAFERIAETDCDRYGSDVVAHLRAVPQGAMVVRSSRQPLNQRSFQGWTGNLNRYIEDGGHTRQSFDWQGQTEPQQQGVLLGDRVPNLKDDPLLTRYKEKGFWVDGLETLIMRFVRSERQLVQKKSSFEQGLKRYEEIKKEVTQLEQSLYNPSYTEDQRTKIESVIESRTEEKMAICRDQFKLKRAAKYSEEKIERKMNKVITHFNEELIKMQAAYLEEAAKCRDELEKSFKRR